MGYKYTDIIAFDNVKDTGTGFGAATLGVKNNFNYNDAFDTVTSINKPVLNAVEIDWNGACLTSVNLSGLTDNNKISTTGQLLHLINDMQGQINLLSETISTYIGE